ncbi:MAG TPA: hypothetical protein VJA21_23230 [Verrucomicrobiae bacterium]
MKLTPKFAIAVVALSCLSLTDIAQAQFSLVTVGKTTNYSTFARGVAVDGNYAFLANDTYGTGLCIYDISDPTNPFRVSTTPGVATLVIVTNNRAFLDDSGMKIYDVANPSSPAYLGAATNITLRLKTLAGNRAFLLNEYGGLMIYDVSDPTNPVGLGSTNLYRPNGVAVSGDYAYVVGTFFEGTNQSSLLSFNISDPANPFLVQRVSIPPSDTMNWVSIAISGDRAYIGGSGQTMRLWIYDISNPTNVVPLGNVSGRALGSRIVVAGNFVFLPVYGLLTVYDVSNPADPFCVAATPSSARDVALSGNYLCAACGVEGLVVYLLVPQLHVALSNPQNVLLSWSVPPVNNFVLQQQTDLATPGWVDVTNTPVVWSNRSEVSLPASAGTRFYRLRSP